MSLIRSGINRQCDIPPEKLSLRLDVFNRIVQFYATDKNYDLLNNGLTEWDDLYIRPNCGDEILSYMRVRAVIVGHIPDFSYEENLPKFYKSQNIYNRDFYTDKPLTAKLSKRDFNKIDKLLHDDFMNFAPTQSMEPRCVKINYPYGAPRRARIWSS